MSESRTTIDHKEIQEWAEARGGKPAAVKNTGSSKDVGILRINFPGGAEDTLEDISWEEFFEKFDEQELALIYQDKTADGKQSRFSKLVSRQTAEEKSKPKNTGAKGSNARSAGGTKAKPSTQRSTAAKASGTGKAAGNKTQGSGKSK